VRGDGRHPDLPRGEVANRSVGRHVSTMPGPLHSIGVVAKRAGVTTKTLHLYDEIGLLRATERTAGGRRLYDDAAVVRLGRITALRSLGFSLDTIGDLLDGRANGVARVLERQLASVRERVEEGQRLAVRLQRIADATRERSRVSTDELLTLLSEANMYERYFAQDQIDDLSRRSEQLPTADEWDEALGALRTFCRAGTPPDDPAARAPLQRFQHLVDRLTGGDVRILHGLRDLWRDHRRALAPTHGIDAELEVWLAEARRPGRSA
jgi:MerR family transcriptional regulator, thiopeptide resistance regulator